ncbi:basic leucine zipper transcriptional factor ATF-like 3 isoform X2 [Eptesicus fuscus]|uniref:basic leucine zipper transcriptional factor ATF-like 3 isoform X2 n=1 Tax=Eptesicus fuscus TaxID=29078 RepID=UPI002403C30F|nr:basic leucine zipper transcriptional factor ATF-like 3 isoform X2 [Eptesicus fuscus]
MSQGLPAAGSVPQRNVAAPGNQSQPQSPEDDDRKVRRREKNRVAAQRSRKKQTQKADKLHEGSLHPQQGPGLATPRTRHMLRKDQSLLASLGAKLCKEGLCPGR